MMEMQAVIGRIQLTRMAQWTKARTQYANMLTETLLPFASMNGMLRLPNSNFHNNLGAESVHAYYKYYVYLRPQNLRYGVTRDTILQALNAQNIPCFSGTCPEIYLEKAFDNHPSKPKERLPTAKQLGEESLMFLVHPSLTTEEMQQMCNIIKQLFTSLST